MLRRLALATAIAMGVIAVAPAAFAQGAAQDAAPATASVANSFPNPLE